MITPMANEVSQTDIRFGTNQILTIVCTSDSTSDIATAMLAGTKIGVYLGSRRRLVTETGSASPAASTREGMSVPSSGGEEGGICIWYSFALVLAVVLFIWNLPGSILSGTGSSIHCVGSSCSYTPNVLAPLGGLYTLLLGLITAAIWSQYLEGGFTSAFDFRVIFRRAGLRPGMTVLVWLMAIVAGIIGGLGVIVVGIGLLFTLPYAFAVIANLYGQFSQRTQTAVTAT